MCVCVCARARACTRTHNTDASLREIRKVASLEAKASFVAHRQAHERRERLRVVHPRLVR